MIMAFGEIKIKLLIIILPQKFYFVHLQEVKNLRLTSGHLLFLMHTCVGYVELKSARTSNVKVLRLDQLS
jgi:hypothetical protein